MLLLMLFRCLITSCAFLRAVTIVSACCWIMGLYLFWCWSSSDCCYWWLCYYRCYCCSLVVDLSLVLSLSLSLLVMFVPLSALLWSSLLLLLLLLVMKKHVKRFKNIDFRNSVCMESYVCFKRSNQIRNHIFLMLVWFWVVGTRLQHGIQTVSGSI